MKKELQIEQIWHNDKHELVLRIDRSELVVLEVRCPHDGKERILPGNSCTNRHGECVVRWFIERYGMDCNGGVCVASSPLRICWTLIGDKDDCEESQLWFMPMTDEVFLAWLTSSDS